MRGNVMLRAGWGIAVDPSHEFGHDDSGSMDLTGLMIRFILTRMSTMSADWGIRRR